MKITDILPWYMVLLIILVVWLGGVYVLALSGQAFGLRRIFVKILLRIFEVCRINIEDHKRKVNVSEAKPQPSSTESRNVKVDNVEGVLPLSPSTNSLPGYENVIERHAVLTLDGLKFKREVTLRDLAREEIKETYNLSHAMDFARLGMEAIIEDEVTKCFTTEELPSWNLLSRTNQNYHYINLKMTILWGLGFVLRYFVLLPIRLTLTVFGVGNMVLCTALIGCLPTGRTKVWLNRHISLASYRIISRAFSAIITYHNEENRAQCGGICVANHTSPIDVVILACDNCYALVGQSQGGLLGIIQRALSRASPQVWFERSETRDRTAVARRLKNHVKTGKNLPILIFPEGTCINNTSVMQFKKGSFEIGGTIYPVAIKYDPRFGDAFWNSSLQTMIQYLLMMMTSWAIVCNVWYLPPMTRKDDESAIEFANRVKSEIANKGGLVDLEWDGQLKRSLLKAHHQEVLQKQYVQSYLKVD